MSHENRFSSIELPRCGECEAREDSGSGWSGSQIVGTKADTCVRRNSTPHAGVGGGRSGAECRIVR